MKCCFVLDAGIRHTWITLSLFSWEELETQRIFSFIKLTEIAYCRLEPYAFSACSWRCKSFRTAGRQSRRGNVRPRCDESYCEVLYHSTGSQVSGRLRPWPHLTMRQRARLPALVARLALHLHRRHHRVLRRGRHRIRSRASLKDWICLQTSEAGFTWHTWAQRRIKRIGWNASWDLQVWLDHRFKYTPFLNSSI